MDSVGRYSIRPLSEEDMFDSGVRRYRLLFICFLVLVAIPGFSGAAPVGNISDIDKFAWSETTAWINFRPFDGGATVNADHLTGYVWSEAIGFIKLGNDSGGPYANTNDTDWGVNVDPAGNCSGNAWSETSGWINFAPTHGGVTLDRTTGRFDGFAWGERIGWIHFQNAGPAYNVAMANTPPNAPTNIIPADLATGVSTRPTLTCSAFSDPDPGNIHSASQWQVCSDGACTGIVHDSGVDGVNLTSYTVPNAVLTPTTQYWWRCRYRDSAGAWSGSSAPTAFTTGNPQADLSIAITEFRDPVYVNGIITYTITVTNAGPDPATNVVVNDPLPAGTVPVSARAGIGGSCVQVSGAANCTFAGIPAGVQRTVVVVVRPITAGTVLNTVTVTGNVLDPLVSNNTATATTTVNPQVLDGGGASVDRDHDGVVNGRDNCPDVANRDQADTDGNGIGDACEVCGTVGDTDGDGVCDDSDNCPGIPNPRQADWNSNGLGDACDGAGKVSYVSERGNDSGNCRDPKEPCKTLDYTTGRVQSGEIIRIARGTYPSSVIDTRRKSVTIEGGWDAAFSTRTVDPADTIVEARSFGAVLGIIAGSGADTELTIDGLTIRGGTGTIGGAVRIVARDGGKYRLVMRNCAILDNRAEDYGGGLFLYAHDPASTINFEISNCTVARNRSGGLGGGLAALSADGGSVRTRMNNVSFDMNTARLAGGAVFGGSTDSGVGDFVFNTSTVSGNSARDGGGIILFSADGGTTTGVFNNNAVSGNTAAERGGGYAFESFGGGTTTATINGGTANGNTAATAGGDVYILQYNGSTSLNGVGADLGDVFNDPAFPGSFSGSAGP